MKWIEAPVKSEETNDDRGCTFLHGSIFCFTKSYDNCHPKNSCNSGTKRGDYNVCKVKCETGATLVAPKK